MAVSQSVCVCEAVSQSVSEHWESSPEGSNSGGGRQFESLVLALTATFTEVTDIDEREARGPGHHLHHSTGALSSGWQDIWKGGHGAQNKDTALGEVRKARVVSIMLMQIPDSKLTHSG